MNPGRISPSNSTPPSVLLIHPPVAKPSEPPAGIARLAGALLSHQVRYSLLDANLDGLLFLLDESHTANDTWTLRACRALPHHLSGLRTGGLFRNIDRYRRAVGDINRVLRAASRNFDGFPGLCDYSDRRLSPVRSQDLLYSAEHPESNPFWGYMKKRLLPQVEAAGASLFGISINYLSQALTGFAMAGLLKRHFPETRIIMGGGLVTSWLKNSRWAASFSGLIDEFVAGPGELPLLELLNITAPTNTSFPPEYGQFHCQDYLSPGLVMPYASSSGCYWAKCSFCPETAEGNVYKPIPPATAVQELRSLCARFKPALIHIVDNAISPAMLKALAANAPGAPWYGFVRATSDLTEPEFCTFLKRSGCVMLKLGIESGDQGVLDYLQKGTTVELSSRVLKALHQAGIGTYVYLLFGTPPEKRAEAERTLAFTVSHQRFIDFLNLAVFNLPANSAEVSQLHTGQFYEGDCALYVDFTHPAGWGRREVRRFLDREFKRDPAVAGILRNQPPLLTSNHAPFFLMHRTAVR